MSQTVWTVGHSSREPEEFYRLLESYNIELVADVRRFPGSRRRPEYSSAMLEAALAARGISYIWIPALGGRRRLDPQSVQTAWRHPAFRAYANHLATEEFAGGLFQVLNAAEGLRTTIMCAEILWWRCHRRLIADVMVSLGMRVDHIRDERVCEVHRLASPACLLDGRLSYGKSD